MPSKFNYLFQALSYWLAMNTAKPGQRSQEVRPWVLFTHGLKEALGVGDKIAMPRGRGLGSIPFGRSFSKSSWSGSSG